MTLKYESEILFDLMKRDGDNTPSDVLPYESELKEKYLKQVEGAYPKLQDYRSEWMNYNLVAHLPADFPVETLTNVTEATVDNVVPYAYGSAILKGQTLVNIAKNRCNMTLNKTTFYADLDVAYSLKANTTYAIIGDITTISNAPSGLFLWIIDINSKNTYVGLKITNEGHFIYKYTPSADTVTTRLYLHNNDRENGSITLANVMLIEYQEGMENWDIPYFEGMQSVKMPVLTTTGNNLFDGELEFGDINSTTGELVNHPTRSRSKNFIKVIPSNSYFMYSDVPIDATNFGVYIYQYDSNRKYIGLISVGEKNNVNLLNQTFTVDDDCHFIKIRTTAVSNLNFDIGVMSDGKNYEPYKSNILTVNEDVELRGIADVRDTLDCFTGEVTQRIKEIVLDGSEGWKIATQNFSDGYIYQTALPLEAISKNNIVCDKLQAKTIWKENTGEGIAINGSLTHLQIKHSTITTEDDFKAWLASSPLTVQYGSQNPTIKTVDLIITNQDGESLTKIEPIEGTMVLTTSSDTIQPLFSGEIPVEAITQHLASFIDLD